MGEDVLMLPLQTLAGSFHVLETGPLQFSHEITPPLPFISLGPVIPRSAMLLNFLQDGCSLPPQRIIQSQISVVPRLKPYFRWFHQFPRLCILSEVVPTNDGHSHIQCYEYKIPIGFQKCMKQNVKHSFLNDCYILNDVLGILNKIHY